MSAQQNRAAKRYARAIFDVVEPSRYDDLLNLLNGLSLAWTSSPDFREAIANPSMRTETKLKVVEAAVQSVDLHPTEELRKFLSLLVASGRVPLLPAIRDDVTLLVREFRKALSLKVTSAKDLPQEERENIKRSLSEKLGSDVGVEWEVDPTIIGGLVLRLGDKLLDRSLAGMLQQMKNHIAV